MKLYIRLYQIPQIGNCLTDSIDIPSNRITVLELKQILYDKYKIPPSEQRLTIKLLKRALVTLTDSFPLTYFYIKHNSIIYLERLIIINNDKSNILSKKSLKLKYLEDIGFYDELLHRKNNRRSSSLSEKNSLDIINESPNEYNEEQLSSALKRVDYIINIIKANKFSNFKEIIEQYKIQSLTALGNTGMNALHCAACNGCVEIVDYIVNVLKDDINIVNERGWTALMFATINEHEQCVKCLLERSDIDVNVQLPDTKRTALHLACKINNVKIVGMLLYKCDYNVVDKYGKTPLEYSNNENIHYLFEKTEEQYKLKQQMLLNNNNNSSDDDDDDDNIINQRRSKGYENDPFGLKTVRSSTIDERDNNTSSEQTDEYPFLKELTDIPKPPPKVSGNVEKSGRKLPIYRERHMEIDPFEGLLKRYKTVDDYPDKPNEVLALTHITNCVVPFPINSEGFNFNFEFTAKGDTKEHYRVRSLAACNEWVNRINEAVEYAKYWENVSKKYSNVKSYLKKLKHTKLVIEIDKTTNTFAKHISPTKKNNNNNNAVTSTPKPSSTSNSGSSSNTRKHHHKQFNKGIIASSSKIQREATLLEDSQVSKGIGFNSFQILELLGTGAFGKVFKVRFQANKQIYTMKVLDKKYLIRNNLLRYAITQCNILRQINNPFIIKLHFSFQTADFLYMILDYCPGGDLSYHVNMNLVDEHDTKLYSAEVVYALLYLHQNGIVFRNLSLENIMISSDGHVKLADLSLVKENVQEGNKELDGVLCCSFTNFVNEEMKLRKGKGRSEDLFNVGLVVYEMLTGTKPLFVKDSSKNESKLGKACMHQFLSANVKDMLKCLLNNNPNERIGVDDEHDIKRHKFFEGINWDKLQRKKFHPHYNLFEIKRNNNKKYITVTTSNILFEEGHSKLSHIFSFNRPQSP